MNDQTRTAKKSLILMVDDNPDNLQALGNLLEKHYKTAVALDGFETLAFVEQKIPDLILLDIMMPGMTGYEVCERLKGDPKTSDIPILFISAMAEIEDKVEAFSRGGVDYITKPFQSKEVLARVATHLSIRNMRLDLEKKNEQLHEEIRRRRQIEEELLKTKKTRNSSADG